MPTDYTRSIPEAKQGGITSVYSFDDLPEALKAYYTANPIDWTTTGTPATKTNVADLLAPVETPAVTPEVTTEPAAQYTAATDYGIPATDATAVATVPIETPTLTPNASTLTATTASPAASTYQASTAYSSDKKKKSKLPYDSILFEAQTSEIL